MIPQRVRASAVVAQATRFEGELPVGALPRLLAVLPYPDIALQVALQGASPRGQAQLHGRVSGRLPMQCLRCERSFDWALEVRLDLRLVTDEEEERRLLQDADPYWVQDDQLPLHDLIEDEVLLGLPMLPRCPACENSVQQAPPQVLGEVQKVQLKENPFAALKGKLKQDE